MPRRRIRMGRGKTGSKNIAYRMHYIIIKRGTYILYVIHGGLLRSAFFRGWEGYWGLSAGKERVRWR